MLYLAAYQHETTRGHAPAGNSAQLWEILLTVVIGGVEKERLSRDISSMESKYAPVPKFFGNIEE